MPRNLSSKAQSDPALMVFTLRQRVVGTVAGAVFCAIARFATSLAFFYCVGLWGTSWWSAGEENSRDALISGLMPALMSGFAGLPIGAVAGWTCQPLMGAVIGGASSGSTCFCLFVVPAELLLVLTRHGSDVRIASLEAIGGLATMILAGAIAGGGGAAFGMHAGGPTTTAASRRRSRAR